MFFSFFLFLFGFKISHFPPSRFLQIVPNEYSFIICSSSNVTSSGTFSHLIFQLKFLLTLSTLPSCTLSNSVSDFVFFPWKLSCEIISLCIDYRFPAGFHLPGWKLHGMMNFVSPADESETVWVHVFITLKLETISLASAGNKMKVSYLYYCH